MIPTEFFAALAKDNAEYAEARRSLITEGDTIRTLAKRAIFAMHRNAEQDADELLAKAREAINRGHAMATMPGLSDEGAFRAGLEEYAEAAMYREWMASNTVSLLTVSGMTYDMHIAALADLTGELQRRQVQMATIGDMDAVHRIHADIETIVGGLMNMDLSGYLRTKLDQAKNSLRRSEEVRYDVSIRNR